MKEDTSSSRSKAYDAALAVVQAEIMADKIAEKMRPIVERLMPPPLPEGVVLPLTISVTDQFQDVVGDKPWFSTYINNEGPNPIYASIGIQQKGRQIPVSWHWEIRYDAPVIKHLYLVCDTGKTATAAVDGAY